MDLTHYLGVREGLKTGDLLVVEGQGLISKVIQWKTKSPYSHVGLLVRFSLLGINRVFLVHSTSKTGIVLLPLSRYLSELEAPVSIIPLQLDHQKCPPKELRTQITRYVMMQLGLGYDFKGILNYLLPWIQQSKADMYCSEFAASTYRRVGLLKKVLVDPGTLVRALERHKLSGVPFPLH